MNKQKKNELKASLDIPQLIVESFLIVSQKKSVANVVLQDIAQTADVAFGTVRYHFAQANKDIAQEAILHLFKTAYSFIDEHIFKDRSEPNMNPLVSYINAMFLWIGTQKVHASFLIYYYYLCSTEVQVALPGALFAERARLRIESLIHEAIGRKLYPPIADVSKAALKIHACLVGCCLMTIVAENHSGTLLQQQLCLEMIDKILTSE